MRTTHKPQRRSVLRVEELNARSLPAVLNPATDLVGDTAIVSSAGDEPADDAATSAIVDDTTAIDTIDYKMDTVDIAENDSLETTSIDDSADASTIRFKPIYFSGLNSDGIEGSLADANSVADESANTDEVTTGYFPPVDEASADGTDASATTDGEFVPKMYWRTLTGDAVDTSNNESDTSGEQTDGTIANEPVVCYFGGLNHSNDVASEESIDSEVADGSSLEADNLPIDPAVCYFGGTFDNSDADTTSVDPTMVEKTGDCDLPVPETKDAVDGTTDVHPNIYFHPMNWSGSGSTEATDTGDDPIVFATDFSESTSDGNTSLPEIQTFGGSTEDNLESLAYSSGIASPVTPEETPVSVTAEQAPSTIDGSAWSFFATKHEEVAPAASAPVSTTLTSNLGVVPPTTTQTPVAAPAAPARDHGLLSYEGTAVKKMLGELSIN